MSSPSGRKGTPDEIEGEYRPTVINIRDLINYLNPLSPIKGQKTTKTILKYSDVYVNGKAANVILLNFALAQHKADNFEFYKYGLDGLHRVLQNQSYDDIHLAQLSILVHVSKWMKTSVTAHLFRHIADMKLSDVTTQMNGKNMQ